MAEFRSMVITNKGQALIAKMMAGTATINFTKISLSSTVYTDAQILALTTLSGVKQTTGISRIIKTSGAAVQVEGAVTNAELAQGYYINTIALHAQDPDEGEIVYAACGASTPGWMPPFNGVSTSGCFLKLVTTVQNASQVTVTVDPAAVATIGDIQDLQKQIDDLQAFIGYTEDDIYGVEADMVNKKFTRLAGAASLTPGADFDDIAPWKRRRCNVTDGGVVVAYYGDAAYSETGALTQAVTIDEVTYAVGTKVQVMVEQPKFYYKVVPLLTEKREGDNGVHMRKARYYVSATKKAGFKVHPVFVRNGVEVDKVYMSAYEGSTYDVSASAYNVNDAQTVDWANDLLASIAGAKPTSGLSQSGATRAGFRAIAAKRGTGWTQATVQSATATELLFLVEYASFDMQSKLGVGVTNKTDDGSTNMSELTGATTNLGNASGSVTNGNGFNIVSYRGEENPFGNIWKWIDGINVYNYGEGSVYIADHTFADNSKTGSYQDAHITVCGANGYVSAFAYNEDFDWLFIASEVNGSASVPVGDYFYQNKASSQYTVAALGGGWHHGSSAGGFDWDVSDASSYRYRNVGGRLLYAPASAA